MTMNSSVILVCFFLVASLARFGGGSPQSPPTRPAADPNAAAVWEQAIAAKGGRELLYSVSNLLERHRHDHYVGLFAFPHKLWVWTDNRPTPLGRAVEMINLDRDLSYFEREETGPPSNGGKSGALARGQPLIDTQLYYLLETPWVKPLPVKLYTGSVGQTPVDIIQTIVNGYRVDFHLDKYTHLPLWIGYPSDDSQGITYGRGTYYATFSDYADVNGIPMPRKVGFVAKPTIPLSVQLNVDYDEQIFERAPSLKAGPDAWQPGQTKLAQLTANR